MRGRQPDLSRIGKRYGRFVVQFYVGNRKWRCVCDCGEIRDIEAASLTTGNSKSCGCYHREVHTTHGLSYSPIRNVHMMMLQRCTNPKHDSYKDYGGRGIKVCERWTGSDGLKNFAEDMGERPEGYKLDRIDNNGDYSPENCRWASEAQQQRNTSRNINVQWDGQTMCLKDWAKKLGIGYGTLAYRIKTWGLERAMTEKIKRKVPVGYKD